MDPTMIPTPTDLAIRTAVTLHEHSYEQALVVSLLAQAQRTGDKTFTVTRTSHITVRWCPETLLDELAQRASWVATRVNALTLTIRGVGLFGIVEAVGSAEQCAVTLQLWASSAERAESIQEQILGNLRQHEVLDVAFSLNWRFLDGKGDIKHASTEERASDLLLDEAYPILRGVEGFIDQYLESPETVLVLQGSPGTGKTRLIRAILAAISRRKGETAEVLYTGDDAVLKSDEVFLEFITQSHSAFVVEDADHLLAPRAEGNQMLHRFLNIADGIASAHGKKIIFSTNLPNCRDIDEALVRPGRCFAHIYLEELKVSEALSLLATLCREAPERLVAARAALNIADRKSLSVAEVYAAHRNAGPQPARFSGSRVRIVRRTQRMAIGFN